MNDENKNEGNKPGDFISDKAEELKEKVKDLADQAEDFFKGKYSEFRKSHTYGKLSDAFTKVEDIMEQKSREMQSGEMGDKFVKFRDKAETKAIVFFDKLKDACRKIGDQVDNTLDSRKGKKDQPTNQDGAGI